MSKGLDKVMSNPLDIVMSNRVSPGQKVRSIGVIRLTV